MVNWAKFCYLIGQFPAWTGLSVGKYIISRRKTNTNMAFSHFRLFFSLDFGRNYSFKIFFSPGENLIAIS